jgi:hypothetical protein
MKEIRALLEKKIEKDEFVIGQEEKKRGALVQSNEETMLALQSQIR